MLQTQPFCIPSNQYPNRERYSATSGIFTKVRTYIIFPLTIPGNITMEDVIIAMPWANTVDVVTIPGSALKSTLEHSVSNYDANSEDPGGRFLQFSGLVATFDVRQEPGSRLVSAKLGRPEKRDEFREIDDEENYQVNFTGLACLFFQKRCLYPYLGTG